MQIIDVPAGARILFAKSKADLEQTADDYVLMSASSFDDLLARVLVGESES